MKSLAPTFVREGIAFIFISVSYEFEGHVDHSELYSGNFTYSEELLVLGYTKKLGLFEKKVTIRTNIPSREGADPVGSEWERVFSHLNNIITT